MEIEFTGGPRDGDSQRFVVIPSDAIPYAIVDDPNEPGVELGKYWYDPLKAKMVWEPKHESTDK